MPRSAPFSALRLLLLPALATAFAMPMAGASTTILVYREHGGWSATIRGSLESARSEINVVAGGNVTVRGGRRNAISYSVTQHLIAEGERQARQAAVEVDAQIQRQNGGRNLAFPCECQTVRLEVPRGAARLKVTSTAGSIDIAEMDGAVVTVNGAGRTSLDQIGGDADIQTFGGDTVLGLIGGNVHCVSGGGAIHARTIRGRAVFETSGGEIYAAETLGAVRAFTGAGGIRIGHAGGSVTATTEGGPIEVGRAAGMVIANNSGGPIRVSSAPGVRCTTESGPIRLMGVSGSVIASTTLGNIIASLFDARLPSNSFLETGGGDITVLIPSNISVTLAATCTGGAGAIVSDYPVTLCTRGPVLTAEGRINGGGPVLQIAARGGTISIKKQ